MKGGSYLASMQQREDSPVVSGEKSDTIGC